MAFSRYRNTIVSFVVNGAKVETVAEYFAWDGLRDSAESLKVGGFDGKIDELMLGGCFRDDSWTHLTYLNQKPTSYWPILMER